MINTVQKLIDDRKVTLNIISTPYVLRDWLDGNTQNSKDIEEAKKYNDECDQEVLNMFLPF